MGPLDVAPARRVQVDQTVVRLREEIAGLELELATAQPLEIIRETLLELATENVSVPTRAAVHRPSAISRISYPSKSAAWTRSTVDGIERTCKSSIPGRRRLE